MLLGRVLPLTGKRTYEEAVAIEGDRIVAVGGRDVVDAYRDRGAMVSDFGERTILPGFVDPHVHLEEASLALTDMVDCRVPRCRSVVDVLETLTEAKAGLGGDDWLVAQANLFWDQKLAERRFPTRAELDSVSRTIPIVIRAGSHRSVLNSCAFERAEPDRLDGKQGLTGRAVVETDEKGEATGVVAEIDRALPLPSPDKAQLGRSLKRGLRDLFTRFGVTTIGEITNSLAGIDSLDALLSRDEVPMRVILHLWVPGTLDLRSACEWRSQFRFASPDDRLRVGAIKVFADGGFSACNAATLQRYRGPHAIRPGTRGRLNYRHSQVVKTIVAADEAGLQLAVHANGERAQVAVCEAATEAAKVMGASPLAIRLEHGGNFVTEDATIDAWRRATATVIAQPGFLYNFFGDFLPDYLGRAGLHGRLPLHELLKNGWRVAGSSDIHVGGEAGSTNPLFSIWCCLERRSFLGQCVEPEQAIDIDEALRMHTIYAAEALGEGHSRGTLAKGKLADVCVLQQDPRRVSSESIRDVKVDFVMVGGQMAYRRPGALMPTAL